MTTTEIVIRLQLELPPGMSLMVPPVAGESLAYRIPIAAKKLGMGSSKVSELVARGDIASIKADGVRLITDEALRDYLARLAGGGDAPAA